MERLNIRYLLQNSPLLCTDPFTSSPICSVRQRIAMKRKADAYPEIGNGKAKGALKKRAKRSINSFSMARIKLINCSAFG